MKFSAAVIGLGRIGLGYDLTSSPGDVLSHSKAFLRHPGFELVGGADPDAANRDAFEKFSNRTAWSVASEMLQALKPQVIAVASPTSTHLAMVETALSVRPLAIVCEKPLAVTEAEGQRIVDACKDAGVMLCVNYMRRFDPALQAVGRDIRAGIFGDIFKGTLWYSKGLLHNGSHYLDILLDWLGPVADLDILDPGPETTMAGPEPDVLFRFTSGCSLYALAAKEENYSLIDLDLVGTRGRLRYTDLGCSLERWHTAADPLFPGYTILNRETSTAQPDLAHYQWHVVEALFQLLTKGVPLPSSGTNGLAVLSLCARVADKMPPVFSEIREFS